MVTHIFTLRFGDGDRDMYTVQFPPKLPEPPVMPRISKPEGEVYDIVYRVPKNEDPRKYAFRKRIISPAHPPIGIRPATVPEIASWLLNHPKYKGKFVDVRVWEGG